MKKQDHEQKEETILTLTQPVKEGLKAIRVQLDHRTIITLASMKMFAFWKQRYPNAKVIG